jgi:hypothetical protein
MDKTAFLRLIEEIDKSLIQRNVPIHLRPMSAIREFCLKQHISIPVVPDNPPIPGIYQGDSLSAHINGWYKSKYGDRLKVDFSPGSAVILIRDDPWKIDFPLIFGNVTLIFDRDLNMPSNALSMIKGLTSEFAGSLSINDLQEIARFFGFAYTAIRDLSGLRKEPLIAAASSDLNTAVDNIMCSRPNYGQSKGASLQFSEKIVKCYIQKRVATYPNRGHNLKSLLMQAHNVGLQTIPTSILNKIQCPAGVRYGEIGVTFKEAIEAHHASLAICSILAPTIAHALPATFTGSPLSLKYDEDIKEGLFYSCPQLGFFYYCEKIEGDLIHWLLIESHQHGRLIQVRFSQLKIHALDYIEVRNKETLKRLGNMFDAFKKRKP